MGIQGKEILIIDDDDDLLNLLKKIMEGAGLKVSLAKTVDEAIIIMKSRVPHVITLDINLGDSSGFEFLRVKNETPDFQSIPVIMLSAETGKKNISKALAFGANDYIVKPIKAKTILQKIRKLLKDFQDSTGFYEYLPSDGPEVVFLLEGDLVKINELSCILESPVKIPKGVELELESEYLKKLGAQKCQFRSVRESVTIGPKIYRNEITFVGMDESIAQKIRQVQKHKG